VLLITILNENRFDRRSSAFPPPILMSDSPVDPVETQKKNMEKPQTRIFINDVLSDVKGILQEDRTCREEFKN